MKKTYLISSIFLFIFLIVPYFENMMLNPLITFFGKPRGFLSLYLVILLFGMILWGLILLTIQWYIDDIKHSAPTKFDLK